MLSIEAVNRIKACLAPYFSDGEDGIAWKKTSHSDFTTKSAYEALILNHDIQQYWQNLWKWRGPVRILVFVWMASHNILLTELGRSSWAGSSTDCHVCQGITETVLHILRDSTMVSSIWSILVKPERIVEFYSLGQEDWFERSVLITIWGR